MKVNEIARPFLPVGMRHSKHGISQPEDVSSVHLYSIDKIHKLTISVSTVYQTINRTALGDNSQKKCWCSFCSLECNILFLSWWDFLNRNLEIKLTKDVVKIHISYIQVNSWRTWCLLMLKDTLGHHWGLPPRLTVCACHVTVFTNIISLYNHIALSVVKLKII